MHGAGPEALGALDRGRRRAREQESACDPGQDAGRDQNDWDNNALHKSLDSNRHTPWIPHRRAREGAMTCGKVPVAAESSSSERPSRDYSAGFSKTTVNLRIVKAVAFREAGLERRIVMRRLLNWAAAGLFAVALYGCASRRTCLRIGRPSRRRVRREAAGSQAGFRVRHQRPGAGRTRVRRNQPGPRSSSPEAYAGSRFG